jgi:hypothetical protein
MPESRLSDRLPGQFLMNTLLLCPGNSGATKYTAHWPGSVEIFMLIINSEKLTCYQKREQRQANGTKVQPGNQKGVLPEEENRPTVWTAGRRSAYAWVAAGCEIL